jgi:hypothetical protein
VVLGKELSSLLEAKANLASIIASRWHELQGNSGEFERLLIEWSEINDRLHYAIGETFGFSEREERNVR